MLLTLWPRIAYERRPRLAQTAEVTSGGGSDRIVMRRMRRTWLLAASVIWLSCGMQGCVLAREAGPPGDRSLLPPGGVAAHALNEDSPSAGTKAEARESSATEPSRGIANSLGMKLVLIPAGEFMMGSPVNETGRGGDEGPQHKVRISRPFYMAATEVTQKHWRAVMDKKGDNYFKGDDLPMERMTWDEAQEFCQKLSAREGRTYRLPTEAEWEYACRAGTTTRYSFGDDESRLGEYAWCYANGGSKTHPVGLKKPNPWGLYDMHGNVLEWCSDWYARGYGVKDPNTAVVDPTGPEKGAHRVLRGGCWCDPPHSCRSARKEKTGPQGRIDLLGLRPVMALDN
jgi:formylglycine-generating enzyme required for sulfatase activity